MKLADKHTIISATCLHYAVLGSLAELEQLKRGLQTAGLAVMIENHAYLFNDLFLPFKQTDHSLFHSRSLRSGVLRSWIKQ